MSLRSSQLVSSTLRRPLKRHSIQVRRLHRMRRNLRKERKGMMVVVKKTEMKMRNWKLYMENRSIIEANEKLRQRAFLLHQENQALLSQLKTTKFSIPPPHTHLIHNHSNNFNNCTPINELVAITN